VGAERGVDALHFPRKLLDRDREGSVASAWGEMGIVRERPGAPPVVKRGDDVSESGVSVWCAEDRDYDLVANFNTTRRIGHAGDSSLCW